MTPLPTRTQLLLERLVTELLQEILEEIVADPTRGRYATLITATHALGNYAGADLRPTTSVHPYYWTA